MAIIGIVVVAAVVIGVIIVVVGTWITVFQAAGLFIRHALRRVSGRR